MTGPLDGVRVLDLTTALSGPFAALTLADLGAEVIKIESPIADDTRFIPPYYLDGESAYYLSINRGKKAIAIDLKLDAGKQLLYRLAEKSDIVLNNYRAGVTKRLGVDHASLKSINPSIITCSLTGFGDSGPYADRPAFDPIIQALSGAMSITGNPGMPPARAGIPVGDLAGGLYAAIGIMAALHRRSASGQGESIDLSLLGSSVSLLTYIATNYFVSGDVLTPQGASHRSNAPYNVYRASDGRWFVVAAHQQKFFFNLVSVLGLPEIGADPRFATKGARTANRIALDEVLQEQFARAPRDQWVKRLVESDVPCAPVNDVGEVFADPQVQSQSLVRTITSANGTDLPYIRLPISFEDEQICDTYPPQFGEHTRPVLSAILGYTDEQITELYSQGVLLSERPGEH